MCVHTHSHKTPYSGRRPGRASNTDLMKRGAASTDPIELADEDSDGDKRRSLSLSRRPAAGTSLKKNFA